MGRAPRDGTEERPTGNPGRRAMRRILRDIAPAGNACQRWSFSPRAERPRPPPSAKRYSRARRHAKIEPSRRAPIGAALSQRPSVPSTPASRGARRGRPFGSRSCQALCARRMRSIGVSFEVRRNEIVGLLGPERRRQDDDAEHDHGRARAERGLDRDRRHRSCARPRAGARADELRGGLRAAAGQSHGRAEPDAGSGCSTTCATCARASRRCSTASISGAFATPNAACSRPASRRACRSPRRC